MQARTKNTQKRYRYIYIQIHINTTLMSVHSSVRKIFQDKKHLQKKYRRRIQIILADAEMEQRSNE